MFGDETLRYFGLEHGALSINSYESGVIPGLLQSEDYIRALTSSVVATKPAEAEQRVRARLRRQERLDGEDPLNLTVVVPRSAHHRAAHHPHRPRSHLHHLDQPHPRTPPRIRYIRPIAVGGPAALEQLPRTNSRAENGQVTVVIKRVHAAVAGPILEVQAVGWRLAWITHAFSAQCSG
ncbi:Scr1 family TA system antitoxin-like transcriptional regulator [Nocardia sp. NPDC051990]|uniref:Scr1 family TA system antitoxin-like transcriptional regulator n=1 Tax=Nocardia sp. NPDC051990 TaxID=3155285 RepID=UPI00343E9363